MALPREGLVARQVDIKTCALIHTHTQINTNRITCSISLLEMRLQIIEESGTNWCWCFCITSVATTNPLRKTVHSQAHNCCVDDKWGELAPSWLSWWCTCPQGRVSLVNSSAWWQCLIKCCHNIPIQCSRRVLANCQRLWRLSLILSFHKCLFEPLLGARSASGPYANKGSLWKKKTTRLIWLEWTIKCLFFRQWNQYARFVVKNRSEE